MIAPSGSSSVLVIEDHPFQRRALAHKLNSLGVPRVLEAASGADALELVRANGGSIALILSSLDVPEWDSLERLHALAAVAPQIAVAALSAFDRAGLRRIAARASASGLHLIGMLEKPVSDDALRAVLVRALADAGGARMRSAG
ncbi:MAG: response regulator [Steroidobacteraceae bacterium]